MSLYVAVPELYHAAAPASQPTCPYYGKFLRQTPQPSTVPTGDTSSYPTASSSTALLLARPPIQYIAIDAEIDISLTGTSVLRTSPLKPESLTL